LGEAEHGPLSQYQEQAEFVMGLRNAGETMGQHLLPGRAKSLRNKL
jgi:hypothetical protein